VARAIVAWNRGHWSPDFASGSLLLVAALALAAAFCARSSRQKSTISIKWANHVNVQVMKMAAGPDSRGHASTAMADS
jgi:biotin-(acetyl-CoA carboxylase) ligase